MLAEQLIMFVTIRVLMRDDYSDSEIKTSVN